MTARLSDEKIALAKKLDAEGLPRSEVCRLVGASQPTLLKHIGATKKPTEWASCECGNHAFAAVDDRHVCLVDPDVPSMLAGKKIFLTKSTSPKQKTIHSYVVVSDWPQPHARVHRMIMGADAGQAVDHESRDTMDNRRCNLRMADSSRNGGNSIQKGGTSKFKGVHWGKRERRWIARIMVNRQGRQIGVFANEEDAARAYDREAVKVFGAFARTNFEVTP